MYSLVSYIFYSIVTRNIHCKNNIYSEIMVST